MSENEAADFFGSLQKAGGPKAAAAPPGRKKVADKRILGALLKTLTGKKEITQEDQDTVMQLTMEKVLEAVGAQKITVFLVEQDDRVHFAYSYHAKSLTGGDPAVEEKFRKEAERLRSMSLPRGQGIVGKVIETAKPYILMDARKDPHFYGGIDKDTGFQTKSMITVPLVTDKVVGAIQVLNKDEASGVPFFTKNDMALLEEVGSYSAKIIWKVAHPETAFTDDEMASYVGRLTGFDYFPIADDFELDPKMVELIGKEIILELRVLPLEKVSSGGVKIGVVNPLDLQRKESFQLRTKLTVEEVVVVTEKGIEKVLGKLKKSVDTGIADATAGVLESFGEKQAESLSVESEATEESAPIVQLANRIIEDAYVRGASDIHIEPQEKETLIRYRVDGVLEEKIRIPSSAQKPLIARLKIMSELDIAEKRLPQDGRIVFKKFTRTGIDVDLRVASAPMNHGEKIVMRILDKTKSTLPLDKLGYSPENLEKYRKVIQTPYGMILHCGPTGSGKSMTLYSALGEINTPDINIQTAEDPIEYTLKGINQLQVRKDIGLTFSSALRSYLRQDPDVILIGEIRDTETAGIAVEAALTGHLLFSTLHTNDASSTATRLLDMEMEPFMVSASLLCVCAQRLLRRLCSKCKEAGAPTPVEMELLKPILARGEKIATINHKKGCDKCGGSGYKGRVGVHELMVVNDEVRDLINKRSAAVSIKAAARRGGMKTLWEDGLLKIKEGITSFEEVIANLKVDE